MFDFSKGHGLRPIVKHAHDGIHAPEHLGQHLILVGQDKARGARLGQGMEALVGRDFLDTVNGKQSCYANKSHNVTPPPPPDNEIAEPEPQNSLFAKSLRIYCRL